MLIYITSPVMPQSQTLTIDTFCRNTLQHTLKNTATHSKALQHIHIHTLRRHDATVANACRRHILPVSCSMASPPNVRQMCPLPMQSDLYIHVDIRVICILCVSVYHICMCTCVAMCTCACVADLPASYSV